MCIRDSIKGDEKWLRTVCPAGGKQCASMDFNHIWGRIEAVYYGFSADEVLRRQASSGGSLTEIASYLLESKKVDAKMCIRDRRENETRTTD